MISIYQIDAHDLKDGNAQQESNKKMLTKRAKKKKCLVFEYESSYSPNLNHVLS